MPPERNLDIDMKERAWIVNEYCHLVNENICFLQRYFEGIVPAGRPEGEIYWKTKETGEQLYMLLEKSTEKEAERKGKRANYAEINRILWEYLKFATEYFYKKEPWKSIESNRKACRNTILNSLQMIANLTVWLDLLGEPSAHTVMMWLELDSTWEVHSVHSGVELSEAGELVLPVSSYGA